MKSPRGFGRPGDGGGATAPAAGVDADLDAAVQAADAAAMAAAISVRELVHLPDLADVVDLYTSIWGRSETPPMSVELLRAFTKAGNYVGGAFVGDRLVGACVGFFHAPSEDALHSHIAGVAKDLTGRHVGYALKLHQRAWALLRGVSEIAWTFDPLVSRNAYFNMAKLAGRPVEYLPDFYGPMDDTINAGGDSDRLLVRWRLRAPEVVAACSGTSRPASAEGELERGAVVALGIDADDAPVAGCLDGRVSLVAVPRDIETLRIAHPALAHRWRIALRESLGALMADGAQITGFDRAGWYVLRRDS
jgi:predicted GNAT superfamily acetyltransferase